MNEKWNVSSSPHIRDKATTGNIMLLVVIALLPATFFGIYNFRSENAWLLVVVTTGTAVLTEYIYEKLMHKPVTIKDCSALVTGLLLALNLPPTLPLCDPCRKTAFRRARSELYEPGSCSTLFFVDFFHREDDIFCL